MKNQKAAVRCADASWPRVRQWLAAMVVAMMTLLGGAAHADGTVQPISVTQPADGASLFADPGWIQNLSQYLPACIRSYHGFTAFGDPQTFEAECIVDVTYVSPTGTCYYAGESGPAVCSQVRCSNCSFSPPTPPLLPARGHFIYLSHYAGLPSTGLQVCPENSTQTGASCTCNDAYTADSATNQCVPKIDVPYAQNPPPPDCEVCKGNPIYPLRGVKREVLDTGLAIGNTTLQFTYDNSGKIPKVWTTPPSAPIGIVQNAGTFGSLLWSGNLFRRVSLRGVSASTAPLLPRPTVIDRGNGISKTMVSLQDSPPKGEPGNADRFILLAGGNHLYADSTGNVQEVYSSAGRLTVMAWPDGTRVDFSYDSAGSLTQAIDNRGHRLDFAYVVGPESRARLSTITDAAGQVTTLSFDSRNNLAGITWPNGTTRTLLYERSDLPWALTGVSDERGLRYSTFGYDAKGRAISTEHAGGVDKYAVSYATPPSIRVTEQSDGIYVARIYDWIEPQGIVMTEPSGQTTTWSALSLNGKNYFSSQTQPAGAGSLQSSRGQGYDENGNIASRDDFNGKRSCYLNDLTRNLRTAQVSGLEAGVGCASVTAANATLPAGAVKTSTQWHPDWSLPSKVAEPGQITTNVYNGQPDPLSSNAIASCVPATALSPDGKPMPMLCKQVVQATTDVDGHLGFDALLQSGSIDTVRTWTYDADGRVLTATDSDTATTTFAYHAETNADHQRGDLQSITTSLGKVTAFERYNRYGQVLQSTDENGIVTLNTYDLRQRLLTNTVGGETTTFSYDAAGQLKKVSFDNGTWVGFDYDDAHRQVAAYDHKANRIDYVLDNAGNRTDERVKDPAGALRRGLARAMDALGRAQQSTGRE